MSKIYPLQNDFSAGQLSSNYVSRSDLPVFAKGLQECINFIPKPQGMLTRSRGEKHMYSIPSTTKGALVPLKVSEELSFVIAITNDGLMRAFTKEGIYSNPATPDDTIFNVSGLFVFSGGSVNLPVDYSYCLSLPSPASGSASLAGFSTTLDISFLYAASCSAPSPCVAGTTHGYYNFHFEIPITSARYNDDVEFTLNVSSVVGFSGPVVLHLGSASGLSDMGIVNLSAGTGIKTFTVNPLGYTSIHFTFPPDNIGTSCAGSYISISSLVAIQKSVAGGLEVTHTFTDEELGLLQYEQHPFEDEVWITTSSNPPFVINYDSTTGAIAFLDSIATGKIVNAPTTWNATDGYPKQITFFQGRLWLGGNDTYPNSFYGSIADGTYRDFGTPDETISSATAIGLTIARKCSIKWLASNDDDLFIGTDVGIYVPKASSGLLTSTDISSNLKLGYGTSAVQPIFVSSRPIFVSFSGYKLRDLVFTQEGQEFNSKEVSFDHDDVLDAKIEKMQFIQDNNDDIVMLSGGDIIHCYYNKHLGIIGWSKDQRNVEYVSIAAISDQYGTSMVYLIDNGSGNLSLSWDGDEYLSNYSVLSTAESNSFTVAHLAEKTVDVITEYGYYPAITLDVSGGGVLPDGDLASSFVVGIPFTSRIKTMPKNLILSIIQNTFYKVKGWTDIHVMLKNSANPTINGTQMPDTYADGPDGIVQQTTHTIKQLDSGWDDEASIEIYQDKPYNCDILAIYGELSEER